VICVQSVCEILGQTSGTSFPHRKQGRKLYECMSANSVRGITPTLAGPEDFLCVERLENRSVFSCSWKCRPISSTYFRCLSNNSHPPRNLWKGATVHDQTCPYVRWLFRWRPFWVFVVKCNLIDNKNPVVIKLGTCIVTALYHL